jgi:DNA polymerase III subunit gamma/tau
LVLGDLAEFNHFVTRVKIVPALADDVSLTEAERTRGRAFATKLSMRVLARTWQMLLKGIAEVEAAGRPVDAAEMVLVRIAYAADLPTPDEVIRSLGDSRTGNGASATPPSPAASGGAMAGSAAPSRPEMRTEAPRGTHSPTLPSPARGGGMGGGAAPMASPRAEPFDEPVARGGEIRAVKSFEDLIALAAEKRDVAIKSALERDVRLVRFEDGRLELAIESSARKSLVGELSKKLGDWTGRRWMVVVSAEAGMPSLRAQAEARKAELKDGVRDDPLVQAVLARFPGAEIVDVRPPAGSATAAVDSDLPVDDTLDLSS